MKKTYLLSTITIIIIYALLSIYFDNDIIFPSLISIIKASIDIILSESFILIILSSLYRLLVAIIIGFLFSFSLATLAYFIKLIDELFRPLLVLIKAIPNIAIIILCLIIFNKDTAVIIIANLVVVPILYEGILASYRAIDHNLIQFTNTLENDYLIKFKRVYIPLIKEGIKTSLLQSVLLAFKVIITSELLAQVKYGIGKELMFAKIYLYTDRLIAWTIIILIISSLFEYLINYTFKKLS